MNYKLKALEKVITERGYDLEAIKSKSRKEEHRHPRMIMSHIMINENIFNTLREIGEYQGGRDHSTIIHHREVMTSEISSYDHIRKEVEEIQKAYLYETSKKYDIDTTFIESRFQKVV